MPREEDQGLTTASSIDPNDAVAQQPAFPTRPGIHVLAQRDAAVIETVNEQLEDQFRIGKNHAHTFGGLCARLASKLTAHTLCIYINRLVGKADALQIKHLVFPN